MALLFPSNGCLVSWSVGLSVIISSFTSNAPIGALDSILDLYESDAGRDDYEGYIAAVGHNGPHQDDLDPSVLG